jgi:transcription factor SPT20
MQQQQQQQQMAHNQAVQAQIRAQGQQLYSKNIAQLAAKFGGAIENIPPEMVENFKRQCMESAKNLVTQAMAHRRAQAVMLQQQQQLQQQQAVQQQQASMQQMGGMMGQGM